MPKVALQELFWALPIGLMQTAVLLEVGLAISKAKSIR
jgi:hypothetical protein